MYTAERCLKCRRLITTADWRRFSNGSVHLVRVCCGTWKGNPLPKTEAIKFGCLETYERACARLTVANDSTWQPDLIV